MFYICFVVLPQGKVPGYNERIVCHSPFVKPQIDQYQRPTINPQTGQPVMVPDLQTTLGHLKQQGWLHPQLPPNLLQIKILGYAPTQQLEVYCAQPTPAATVAREQVTAPFNQPVGNPGAPNEVLPLGPHGGYDSLPNSALPSNADPMFGAADGYGGASQNLDLNQGINTIHESADLTGTLRRGLTQQEAEQRAAAERARLAALNPNAPPMPVWAQKFSQ